MKRVRIVCLAIALVLSFVLSASAAETMKGTIRGIDKAKGTITFCPEGTTDKTLLNVDKSVDMSKIDTDMKVQIDVDSKDGKKTVRGIKVLEKKRKAIEGC